MKYLATTKKQNMENKSNISFRRQMELELIEEKYIALKIEIRGNLDGLLAYQKNASEYWKELNTYKEAVAQIEILTRLEKLL